MALQILEKNGTFELKGSLTSNTTKSFVNHFELILKTMKDVTINIDHVDAIDVRGVEALKGLLNFAFRSNAIFSIIGDGCKDIYDDYRTSLAA